jgi:F0F1-type ATP synthase assembly protein I
LSILHDDEEEEENEKKKNKEENIYTYMKKKKKKWHTKVSGKSEQQLARPVKLSSFLLRRKTLLSVCVVGIIFPRSTRQFSHTNWHIFQKFEKMTRW